MGKVNIYYSPE